MTFDNYFSKEELADLKIKPFTFFYTHPRVTAFLIDIWKSNFKKIGFEELPVGMFEIILDSQNKTSEEIISIINAHFNANRDFKRHARKSRKSVQKMDFGASLLAPHMTDTQSILDYGCGRMALLRRLARIDTKLKHLYGFDPGSLPEYVDFDPRAQYFSEINEVEKLESIDLVHSSYVFHHLTKDEIQQSLHTIRKVLKPGGRFILIEETFPVEDIELKTSEGCQFLSSLGFDLHIDLTQKFSSLSTKNKFLAILLNDILANLKNLSYMPWTFEYNTMEEWRRIVENQQFRLEYEYYCGIPRTERLKQGLTSLMVFRKDTI